MLRAALASLDAARGRFRADSELRALRRAAGSVATVSPLLGEVVDTALCAAELTDGAVDPTVGATMAAIGHMATTVPAKMHSAYARVGIARLPGAWGRPE
jgi:thiamine biosynthesis lipoprotein ApbE